MHHAGRTPEDLASPAGIGLWNAHRRDAGGRRLDLEAAYWRLLQNGLGTIAACEAVGIGRKTGYRWRAENGGLPPAQIAEAKRSDRYLSLLEQQGPEPADDRVRPALVGGPEPRPTTRNWRVAVRNAITTALDRLAEHDTVFAQHLRIHIRTGSCCRYETDPVNPIEWNVST
jgi:hypothetical protein